MGSNLHGFEVKLTFDTEGQPETAIYWDQEGCGHEQQFSIEVGSRMTVRELAEYHLAHYKRSHEMTPIKRCTATGDFMGEAYYCSLERHNTVTIGHNFIKKGRS